MNRLAARTDRNHTEIVRAFRKVPGCTVMDLSAVGHGCPDIAVGYRGVNYYFEIKDGTKPPSRRKLTKDQVKWHQLWCGQVAVISTEKEVYDALGMV